MSFSNTGGTWSLRESSNSSEPVAELSGYAQVLLRSTNPNSYTVDMNNVKIAVYASAPPVPSNQVASGPWPAAMSWLEVPGGNKWTETTRPIKVAWQLTGTESARVLAKGLLDCGIAAEKLPSHLVAQAASKGNDESQTLVTVRTRARKVVGVFGVRVATDSEWTSKLPASSLLCPDPAVLTSRANLERLSTLLNDAWHVKKD
ncbi:hypothetical protein GGF31_002010 [Allomyces arbusculus]|nr:hypothetical protein GGF31_002010 [Allomyces arbusculus]